MINKTMTVPEMVELYTKNNLYAPNKVRVGKYAKQIGYKLVKQMKNRKVTYFYMKV